MSTKKEAVRHLQLINDDWLGHADHLRHACRGILLHDGKILLIYEANNDKYIIPGGGLEDGETLKECCEREMLEETGMVGRAVRNYLEIEELFDVWRHINHYFICELVEDSGKQHLTEGEKRAGYTHVWVTPEEALAIFGRYEDFRTKDIADFGLYRREYTALREYYHESENAD